MKKILSSFFFVTIIEVVAMTHNTADDQLFYVVVGGFTEQQNAARFTEHVKKLNYPAQYAYNAGRNLYYVYVNYTSNRQGAKDMAYKIRTHKSFKDAWVYNGLLIDEALAGLSRLPEPDALASAKTSTVSYWSSTKGPAVEVRYDQQASESITKAPAGKHFVFKLSDHDSGKPVKGKVKLLESEKKADNFKWYAANEQVFVQAPGNHSGKLVLVCDLFGYKPVKKAFLYDRMIKGAQIVMNGSEEQVVIPVGLEPVKQGEYIDLEHVRFYENSAILTPESEHELMELVHFMENPNYKIRLHGHVASDEDREIVIPAHHHRENIFDLNASSHHRHHASAKALSRHRAETIKGFLVTHGIEARRVHTKGYGAMLAIFEHAHANDRIEVEIVKD